jgi:hypothetical protein
VERDQGPFYHGTRAALAPGDLIVTGHPSNYGAAKPAAWVYMTALLEGAVLAAEVATNGAAARVYRVTPTGHFEDDPNVTDKKFPGNPTRSYRTRHGLRVEEEIIGWTPTPPLRLQEVRELVDRLRGEGIEAIE